MAYDTDLAARIRDLIAPLALFTERSMFGGLAFLVGGNMAVAASSQGGIFVRVDPAEAEQLLATTAAVPMVMRGAPMKGWLRIDAAYVTTDAELAPWVERGVAFAAGLPAKEP